MNASAIPETCPHSASQNMGGACEACIIDALRSEDDPEKIADMQRPTTILTRFEVGDPLCGQIACYSDRPRALDRARGHQVAHAVKNDPDPVTVFDRMAHIGDTCLWGSDGRGIEKRTR